MLLYTGVIHYNFALVHDSSIVYFHIPRLHFISDLYLFNALVFVWNFIVAYGPFSLGLRI